MVSVRGRFAYDCSSSHEGCCAVGMLPMTVFALGLIHSIRPLCVVVSSVYLPKLLDTESPLTTATENGFLVWYWCALWQGEDVPIPPPPLAILILSKLIPMNMWHRHSLVLLWLVIDVVLR